MYDGITWEGQYTLWQQLISDSDATNLVMGKTLIKAGQRRLEAILGLNFMETRDTFTTYTDAIAGTSGQDYKLPMGFKKFRGLYVTVGTTQYPAELIQDEDFWRTINSTTTQQTSAYVQFCFIRRERISIWPIPASTDTNTATLTFESTVPPLTQDDYSDGTITTLANASTDVTGSNTAFTSAMVNRYFRIDSDGRWYRVGSFTSTTNIDLDAAYEGVSIAAGTEAYTIGQMPITPSETHELPVYYAVWKYALFRKDVQTAREFERMWKEGVSQAQTDHANLSASDVIDELPLNGGNRFINPNYYPQNMS